MPEQPAAGRSSGLTTSSNACPRFATADDGRIIVPVIRRVGVKPIAAITGIIPQVEQDPEEVRRSVVGVVVNSPRVRPRSRRGRRSALAGEIEPLSPVGLMTPA
jgi:hypothetical protein